MRLLEIEVAGRARPLLGEWRSFCLVERELERREPEQRALEPDRAERDANLLEQIVARQRGDLRCAAALHHLRQHRGRGLRDGAAAAGELHLVDRVAVVAERDEDRYLVPAERVLSLGAGIGVRELPMPARVLVVIEDHFPVELVELAHAKSLWALCRPSTRRS